MSAKRKSDAQWDAALDRLFERADVKPLAELLRGEDSIPDDARQTLAELLDPQNCFFPIKLTIQSSNQRAQLEKKMRRRARTLAALAQAKNEGLTSEEAAEKLAEEEGLSERGLHKRADARNPDPFYRAHKDVAEAVAHLRSAGVTPQKFIEEVAAALARANPTKPRR